MVPEEGPPTCWSGERSTSWVRSFLQSAVLTGDWRHLAGASYVHGDFLKLWAGQTVSLLGDQVTSLALPLTAAVMLAATPVQMGILTAVQLAPVMICGLFVGVWADRLPRRPIMLASDIARALLLASIPGAGFFGVLRIEYLYAAGLLVGVLSVFFTVASAAYLPALVGRQRLVEANSRLALSRSVAQILGPGLAGVLVQVLTAPVAILVDAMSFVGSAVCLVTLRPSEEDSIAVHPRRSVWTELAEGLHLVLDNALLRVLAAYTGTLNFFGSIFSAIAVLYVVRDLGITPAVLGLIFVAAGPGGLVGGVLVAPLTERYGLRVALVASSVVGALAILMFGVAGAIPVAAVPVLVVAQVLIGLATVVFNITVESLLQRMTPDRLQGRVHATWRVLTVGVASLGALAGGVLGEVIGLAPTVVVAAAGGTMAIGWLFLSPVRSLHDARPVRAAAVD